VTGPTGSTGDPGPTGVTGDTGPTGPTGAPAIGGSVYTNQMTFPDTTIAPCSVAPCESDTYAVTYALCNSVSDILLSGGWTYTDHGGPFSDGGTLQAGKSFPTTANDGTPLWWVELYSVNGVTHVDITVYAICLTPGPV